MVGYILDCSCSERYFNWACEKLATYNNGPSSSLLHAAVRGRGLEGGKGGFNWSWHRLIRHNSEMIEEMKK